MNLEEIKPDSLEFQVGIYVGEYVINRNLPTLSTDMIQTLNVIKVSDEDTSEHERLNNEWVARLTEAGFNSGCKFPKEWNAYLTFRKIIQKKYMPELLVCYVPKINVSEEGMEDFKNGFSVALWDCDCCSYYTDNDKVKIDSTGRCTVITLQLNNEYKLEKE